MDSAGGNFIGDKIIAPFYTACKIILATLRIPTKFCELME